MNMLKVPAKSWVVVCDGAKAQILQNAGDTETVRLRLEESLTQPDEPNRELGADRPGRTQQSVGTQRSAMEETDWHEAAEEKFLRGVVSKVEALVTVEGAAHIILVAPPKALGYVRPLFSAAAQNAIKNEVCKDVAKLTPPEIEKHLMAWASA